MGERTKYTPGAFSWTDLTTTDPDAAKRFYTSLFGWEVEDIPVGEGMVYSMMKVGGKNVAAISAQPQQQRDAGVPPVWNSYVTVDSADAALARARELGATVHADAFDVMDAGRMGVIQDPQGAYVEVWEPKTNIGAQLVNAPGALCWNELATNDTDASAGFYTQLFGWSVEPMEGVEMPYSVIKKSDGSSNGGIRPAQGPEPNYWLNYFGTNDVDGDFSNISDLGGQHLLPPTDIGVGRIGIAQDPQGAVFALYSGQFDD
jgi:predicted enzyme related to lactoylglutathione lyase